MSGLYHPHPSEDDLPANKRRKVNTCLQCKARKVKCDKVRPLCGPCQRRRIPADRCVFADEADPETLQHYLGPDYLAQQGYDVADVAAQPTAEAGLLGLQDPQARAVLDRITREMRHADPTPAHLADQYHAAGLLDPTAINGSGAVQDAAAAGAERVALDPSLTETLLGPAAAATNGNAAAKDAAGAIGSLEAGNLFPFAAEPTHERTKLILGLLPNDHVVNVLLDSLRTFESKSPLGISWRLIRIQLINLRGDIADWRSGQVDEPDVDLTFLALLFELMVAAIDCKPGEQVISEGIALTLEQVPEMTDRWHATCQALLAMSTFMHEPNLNTVCTQFLFYLYELRRGRFRVAVQHLKSSFDGAKAICMHQLGSAHDDVQRWQSTPEEDDATIRTGAVIAMRKAQFEGGEVFALSEEQRVLAAIRAHAETGAAIRSRELVQTNLPDRTHLVREAARMLWTSLTWHLELVTPAPPLGEALDDTAWTTALGAIDEAHLSDGETAELPTGATLGSLSTHFFQFLAASTAFMLRQRRRTEHLHESELLPLVGEWNAVADAHLARIRDQVAAGRAMLSHFSLLIHHWTRIRLLRPHLGVLEANSSLAASRATLVDSCTEALAQLHKIAATPDVELSIFQPVVAAAKVDATLVLAIHLVRRAEHNDANAGEEWTAVREAVKTARLLLWTPAAEAAHHRLAPFKPWARQARQLVEQLLQEAFERKRAARIHQPRIKQEDDQDDAGEDGDEVESLGPLAPDSPLGLYRDQILAVTPIYESRLFFDVFDGFLRSL
ncbi:uncharacterized protein PAN0_016c5318 [Moesziomyces antarcticus]|uniref:Uncharacterized protein n=2 Tax=Pseudozyma antarctica TaxID=84753 RepID=A0A081CK96_PSEA2|nr:uncharacterized protein PAN0_016c5318 [Moesziomyces antarcticus]GAK67092.1 conserved hypothetical protein [Moesziomyces antarcticus]SPO48342.1 uncharacterized protein PSANT_06031 [Moesziomyces antarcticus]